jgi:predicted RNA-binding Zn ribbon-like protein
MQSAGSCVTIVYAFAGNARLVFSPATTPPVPELTLASVISPVERQPGDRPAAPGQLGLLQGFVNSRGDLDGGLADRFADRATLRHWLLERELIEPVIRISRTDLERVLNVRDGLRALLFVNNGAPADRIAIKRLNRALVGPGPFVALNPHGSPDFKLLRRDLDGAISLLATIVAVAQLDGSWSHLKACRGDHCGWTFYDYSRNQSGNWCAMSVCGSRAKARDYRRRRRLS